MKSKKGMFMRGIWAFREIKPEFRPIKPPNPATVVQVISVAKPNPDVGITKGRVTMSSRRLLPKNRFLARTYARGIPKTRSKTTVEIDNLNEKKSTLRICLQFSSPIIGFANTSKLTSFHLMKT